jgi:hypothetical protein
VLQVPEQAAAPPAAEAPETGPPSDARRVYAATDFARFAPRTALDMVRQVPGFSIQGQSQERGLGQASGNVLLNGQRISGKSNDAMTALGRIPAARVERIEIADAPSFNIAGLSGQVVNVVARSGGLTGQFQWRGEARPRNTEPLFTNGSVSLSGTAGALDYTVGLRNDSFRQGNAGPSLIAGPEGSLIDLRREQALISGERPRLSGNFRYRRANGAVANVNLSYERLWFDLRETSDRRGPGLPDRLRVLRTDQERYSYEIGGDYSTALGPGQLKLIGLRTFEHNPSDSRLVTSFATGAPPTGSRFLRDADESETIGRAEYRLRAGRTEWEVSAEAAFNSLDNVSNLFTLRSDGTFVETPLPGGTAEVTEDRYQGAVSWARPLTPTLALQASIGAEYSQLAQSGPLGQTRSFVRPKGYVAAAWKASPNLDINARIERRVGQLNFSDFLASANLGRDTEDAANPDLVPPQSWDAEIEARRNFGAWGTTRARVYTRLISDIIDQIPIGLTQESAGNIDSARVLGVGVDSTLQLAQLGWTGAKLDARLQLQTSRLADPLTGDSRPISNELVRLVDLRLRHDVPGTDWAWGGELTQMRRAPIVRLGETIENFEMSPFNSALFVEHKDVLGLTVRAAVRNLLGADDISERSVFAGRRTGSLAFVESRNRSVGPVFALGVSGSF